MSTRQVEARTQAVSPESGVGGSAHVASTTWDSVWAIRMDPAAWEKGLAGNMEGIVSRLQLQASPSLSYLKDLNQGVSNALQSVF